MRDVGKKREIYKARDFIKVKLTPRRGRPYKYKVTPNEIKGKNTTIILEKASARVIKTPPNIFLNIFLNTRNIFKKYLKRFQLFE